MARKTKNASGEVADKRISVVVINSLYEKISVLADIKFGGSTNALVTELLKRAAENDAAIIAEGLLARKSYTTRLNNLKEKLGLAQDSTTSGESATAEDSAQIETPPADETPSKARRKKDNAQNKKAAPSEDAGENPEVGGDND